MKIKFVGLMVLAMALMGCSATMQQVSDGPYKAVIVHTYGHPAVTYVTLEKDGIKVGEASGQGKAVGLHLADNATAVASMLALGLPAGLIRPDQTNVTGIGGGASASSSSSLTSSPELVNVNSWSPTNTLTNANKAYNVNIVKGRGWVPPGQDK